VNFDQALDIILKHEGGYVNHPNDPGGETNYGITKRVAVANGYMDDMESIPMEIVRKIYLTDYWIACRCDELPAPMRLPVFDAAVNSGTRRSIQWLQAALGVTSDGVIGPKTIAAATQSDHVKTARNACFERLTFLTTLNHFATFGRGWTRRVIDILRALQ
jgi:lysozyme family protein